MSNPEAPPTYAQATGPSTASTRLEVPQSRNGIPAEARRSMEDEQRALPPGWIRQFDSKEQHQFFVDTNANPPRSIWHHPHDDEEYLKTLSSAERERLQESERDSKVHFDTTDDESGAERQRPDLSSTVSSSSVTGSTAQPPSKAKLGLGQRLKNKITGTTHEERVQERRDREVEEARYYQAHQQFRQAMYQAQITGQPQLLGKDRDGKDVFVEPPSVGYGGGGMGMGSYGGRGYGYNPYTSGPYADPNARFIRPSGPYGRPYGRGYGGGYGLPIAGGLLGGMMLGGLLF